MKGTAALEHTEMRLLSGTGPGVSLDETISGSQIATLKNLAHALLAEVQSLGEIPTLDIKHGIDFYDEIRRFEIDLIQRALACTGGNQVRAARLLNLKVTTLNSKIKHYDIQVDVLVGGYVPVEPNRNGSPKPLLSLSEAGPVIDEPRQLAEPDGTEATSSEL